MILKEPSEENINLMISLEINEIKDRFGEQEADEFKKAVENKKIFCSIKNIEYIDQKIIIPEESYLYDYIIKNNVFKKYEKEIINLLNIIYTSEFFKNLVRIIYKTEYKVNKFYFEENDFIQDFWDNNIIFVPYKIKSLSGFSYKDTFKIFFCIYKIRHFESEIENEIFTLGAFIRVLIHESFGHLIIANIFYMFYANIYDYTNYFTPEINSQMGKLDINYLCEYIGNILAKIFYQNIDLTKQNESENSIKLESLKNGFDDSIKNKLSEEFKHIIWEEYAKELIKELEKTEDIQTSNTKNNDNLSKMSKRIVDILVTLISNEFNNYISNLKATQEKLKKLNKEILSNSCYLTISANI